MSLASRIRGLVLATALACPAYAHAVNLTLNFTGVVSPGSHGDSAPYFDCCESATTSFDGQPVAISISLAGRPDHLYVDQFSASWSDAQYDAPFVTSWSGAGFPPQQDDLPLYGFFSDVSIDSNGGHIVIFPTLYYTSYTNNQFFLNLDYSYSQPRSIYDSFSDINVTGGGGVYAYQYFGWDFAFNPPYFTGTSGLNFSLTSMSQVSNVPEPSIWAVMVLGFGLLGGGIRQRRNRLTPA